MSEEKIQEAIWKRKVSCSDENSRIISAARLLESGKKILDIGCGPGQLYDYAKDRYSEVYGIDLAPTAVRAARRRGMKARKFDLNAAKKMPFNSNSFDSVVCLDVIDYMKDPDFIIKEISRVLRKNGTLILSFPNVRAISRLYSLAVRGRFPRTSGDTEFFDGGHIHYFTTKDICHMLEKNGFKVKTAEGMLPDGGRRKNLVKFSAKLLGKTLSREFILHGTIVKAVKQ